MAGDIPLVAPAGTGDLFPIFGFLPISEIFRHIVRVSPHVIRFIWLGLGL